MQSWLFSSITPVFSVTWSFRNHFLMCWFVAQLLRVLMFIMVLIIINFKHCFSCLHFFVETMIHIFLRIIWGIENSKEQSLFEIYFFCDVINAFAVTFDQFNKSLLNQLFIFVFCIFFYLTCPNLKSISLQKFHKNSKQKKMFSATIIRRNKLHCEIYYII